MGNLYVIQFQHLHYPGLLESCCLGGGENGKGTWKPSCTNPTSPGVLIFKLIKLLTFRIIYLRKVIATLDI